MTLKGKPKFELTQAAFIHAAVTMAVGLFLTLSAAYFGGVVWYSPMLLWVGVVIYGSREVRDIQKSCKGDLSKWNSAEFILPVIVAALMFAEEVL